ncbi:sulfate transporter CysZ [Vibrio sp. SS-MA-C1-2]|uniref:sulfate transporter CysZ n=1 Tax=Vibrio sp. SS-MA-C1-2 TaxID=2908646 RepID=UPI001F21584B|nr:sulfate transporter CysZ [Vibrio sp. SS-MA-C1-2]UJF19800.1 sulfate transporter CysZ [Vibrio sp. SS-MA-C1-2]
MKRAKLITEPASGAGYLLQGFKLALQPGVRRFILIPLLINFLLFGAAFGFLLTQLGGWIDYWLSYLPTWMEWLSYLLWPLITISILVTFSYFFSMVANWVAAPFNGLLSEYLESRLTGEQAPDTSMGALIKDIPRVFRREWQKLWYYLPKALGLLILLWIPGIGQTIGPVLWFLFSAWMMSIQYSDYPFDNHKVPFHNMRKALREQKGTSISFGSLTMLFAMIPFVNLIIMPIAVCGATAMWVDKFRHRVL